jgi:cell wall-associated NlpC family hydrolase
MNAPRALAIGAAGLLSAAVLLAAAIGVVSASVGGVGAGGGSVAGSAAGDGLPSAVASSGIPAGMLTLYREAAATCPGLPWTVLAAIGTVESGNGTSELPGVHSGANSAGAEGPMQFEPATFAAYDVPVPDGGASPPNPYDPTDAVFAAARMLCANGAGNQADVGAAVYDYNHSDSYVTEVLDLAQTYGQAQAGAGAEGSVGATADAGIVAVKWALAQVGTPYVWGGETPGVGFDCSGLVQAAYQEAGITLPRVAQDQFDAGPELPPGASLEPGDLVFFGGGPTDIEHVGVVVAPGVMVDAPYTGADVREDTFPTSVGAPFGDEEYVGTTRPA